MHKPKPLVNAVRFVLTGATLSSFFSMSHTVYAQEQTAEGNIEEVRVTGSRIRRIDVETASPVISLSLDNITESGFNSIQDALADLPQNAGGSLDQQQVFGFTPAASGVDLRGAGVGRSLVLINGKRTPKYPIASNGTDNFSDTTNIPLGAVDRIEVLTSGGSAVYGSDAMGGVINIILKEKFEGLDFTVKHGDTSHGGRETNTFSLLGGTATEDTSLMFFIEHDTKDALKANQRNNFSNLGTDLAFGQGAYSSYGISLRNTKTGVYKTLEADECTARGLKARSDGICGFNRSDRRYLYPDMERTSMLLSFKQDVGFANFNTRIDYTHSEVSKAIEPMPVADYSYYVGVDKDGNADPGYVTLESDLSGSTARFAQNVAFGGDFVDAEDGTYYPTRRMYEFGDRRAYYDTNNFSVLSSLEGEVGGWNWSVDWMFARTDFYNLDKGYASADSYFNYLSSGESGRSVFDEMTQAEVDSAWYEPWNDAQSNYTGFSANADGELFELPAGTVSIATGAETYREWFYNTSDSESIKGNILSTGGSSGEGNRSYDAVFVETFIPILNPLSASIALRYDKYNDFGSQISPQLSMEYRPVENILIRALWGESFRAPDMQRVYGDPTRASQQIYDPYSCKQQKGTIDGTDEISLNAAACNGELYVDVVTGPNSDLDPETGDQINIGVVLDFGNFNASIDYWEMNLEDIVNDPITQDVATNYETYASLITRNSTGDIEVVNATAQNLSFRETAGIDFSAGYKFDLDSLGMLDLKLKGSYMLKYDEQFSELVPVQNKLKDDRVPDLRMQFSTGWTIQNFNSTLYFNYISEMNGTNNDILDESFEYPTTIDSQLKVNWSAGYQITSGLSAQLGINNLTDEGPNPDYTDNGWPYYPQEYYNALGRNYYVSLNYSLK